MFNDCNFHNITYIENPFFEKISSVCTNIVWITGDEDCSKNAIKSKGLNTQITFGDTYWDRHGNKRLFGNKTLRVGVIIVSTF